MGYRRDAAIWMPEVNPKLVWQAARQLKYEPACRTTIGVWQDNCYVPVVRNYLIDMLIAAGLDVRSYGECRRTVPDSYIERGKDANGGEFLKWHTHPDATCRPKSASHGARPQNRSVGAGMRECKHHRIMMALQHSVCVDYVTNLEEALLCGAIPIIHQIAG